MASRPIRLICVDENTEMCEALRRYLREPRFEWLGSAAGPDALDGLVERAAPDLVVMEIASPEGLEWTRRAKERWPALRVVVLTATDEVDVLREALLAGVDGLISKLEDPRIIPGLLEEAADGHIVVGPEMGTVLSAAKFRRPGA